MSEYANKFYIHNANMVTIVFSQEEIKDGGSRDIVPIASVVLSQGDAEALKTLLQSSLQG